MSATRCYCGELLRPDGSCRYGCPPEANPKLLRSQARALRDRSKAADQLKRGTQLTIDEVRAAAAKVATPGEAARVKHWTRYDRARRRLGR